MDSVKYIIQLLTLVKFIENKNQFNFKHFPSEKLIFLLNSLFVESSIMYL